MFAVMSERASANKAVNEKCNKLNFLKQFFPFELILIIVSESNEYAKRQGARNWSDVTTAELSVFMGLHIVCSVLFFSSYKQAWYGSVLIHATGTWVNSKSTLAARGVDQSKVW